MRCKACNRSLSLGMLSININTGEEDELCNPCLSKSYSEYNVLVDKEYQHADSLGIKPHASEDINTSGYFYEMYDNP